MVARILTLQEKPDPLLALQKSLERDHQLTMMSTVEKPMKVLNSEWIDLIISRVQLANNNILDFLNRVKENLYLQHIPFIEIPTKLSDEEKEL